MVDVDVLGEVYKGGVEHNGDGNELIRLYFEGVAFVAYDNKAIVFVLHFNVVEGVFGNAGVLLEENERGVGLSDLVQELREDICVLLSHPVLRACMHLRELLEPPVLSTLLLDLLYVDFPQIRPVIGVV